MGSQTIWWFLIRIQRIFAKTNFVVCHGGHGRRRELSRISSKDTFERNGVVCNGPCPGSLIKLLMCSSSWYFEAGNLILDVWSSQPAAWLDFWKKQLQYLISHVPSQPRFQRILFWMLDCLVYLLLFYMQERARSLSSHCVHIVLMDLLCLYGLITANSQKHRSLSVYANKAEPSTWELIFAAFKCILNRMFVFRA